MKRRTLSLLVISMLIFGVACKQGAGKLLNAGGKVAGALSKEDESARNELVDVYNEAQSEVREWEENYAKYVDFKKGPEADLVKSDVDRFLWSTYTVDAGTISNKLKPLDEKLKDADGDLKQQGEKYVAALKKLLEITEQVKTYYKQGSYKDDNLAKGNTLHPQLVQAFQTYFAAEKGVNDALTALENKELEDMITEAKDKMPIKYKALLAYKTAQQLVDANKKKGEVVDTAAILKTGAAYEKEVEDLKALVTKEKQSADATKAAALNSIESYLKGCDYLVTDSKNLTRKLTKPELQREKVEDLQISLVRDYNSLVSYFRMIPGLEM